MPVMTPDKEAIARAARALRETYGEPLPASVPASAVSDDRLLRAFRDTGTVLGAMRVTGLAYETTRRRLHGLGQPIRRGYPATVPMALPDMLRVWEETGRISETARRLCVNPERVRKRLIRMGLHTPRRRE